MTINAADLDSPITQAYIDAAKAAGHIAAGQYLKHMSPAVVALAAKNEFGIWLIDEGWGNAAVFARGAAGGALDGRAAAAKMQALGAPEGTVVYFAIDYGAGASDLPAIQAYYTAYALAAATYHVGMYADGFIASNVSTPVGDYLPGASGWPGYAAYAAGSHVAILQHAEGTLFGYDVDPCEVRDTSVLWFPKAAAAAAVVAPTPQSVLPSLGLAQIELGVAADGVWGPETAEAFARHYAS